MKRGMVLVNAYTQAESELNQPRRIHEELKGLGVDAPIVRNAFVAALGRGGEIKVPEVDFCVYLDKDKYAGTLLTRAGVRLFNRMAAVEACDDKMTTLALLAGEGIPMPATIPAPLCYYPQQPYPDLAPVEALGYPVVVKECYGSLGKGVNLAQDRAQLRSYAQQLKGKPHLFEEYIATSRGRDVRVIVVGGRVLGSMLRRAEGDFRSNAALGGRGERFSLDAQGCALCERVAKCLQLDYCGIDLLFGQDGWLVCEVNSNAFFGTFERVTGINVAQEYARHILSSL